MIDVIGALNDLYEADLAVWDLSPETLLLSIGPEIAQQPTDQAFSEEASTH